MSGKIKNVSKKTKTRNPRDRKVPLGMDKVAFFGISFTISAFISTFLTQGIVTSPFLEWYHVFFSLIGIYVITDAVSGYTSSILVSLIVSKTYNAEYFNEWYSRSRRNLLRNVFMWVMNAAFFLVSLETITASLAISKDSFWLQWIIYLVVKIFAFVFAHLAATYLMNFHELKGSDK